jgi:predicted metal-binding protein
MANLGHLVRLYLEEEEGLAQWLRAPTALSEVLSSIPSNHMVAHNHL